MQPHLAPLLLLVCLAHAREDELPEWGGFRGNNGAGQALSAELPSSLDLEQGLRWRTEIPAGYSSPTVCGEHVFVTGAEQDGAEGGLLSTIALERATGEIAWVSELEYEGSRPGASSPAAPSPVTDGERVYSVFHHFGIVALDMQGEVEWELELAPFDIPHGMSTSAVVHGGTLVLQVDQDNGAYLLALDKATGEELWRVGREGTQHGYSTPAIHSPEEGPAQVVVSGSFQIAGYALEDGRKLWWVDGSAWQATPVPLVAGGHAFVNAYQGAPSEFGMPTFAESFEAQLEDKDSNGNGLLERGEWEHEALQQGWFLFDLDGDDMLGPADYAYAQRAGRARGGLFAIRLDGEGDVTATHVDWVQKDRRGLPGIPSPVLVGDHLFVIKRGGLLSSIDVESGEVVKQERVGRPDAYYASPIAAGDRVLTASQNGTLTIIKAEAEWEVLASAELEEEIWSTPAVAGGQVFVRSLEALYCFGD